MLTLVIILVFFVVAALVIAIAMQPDEFALARSVVIDASPSTVFPYVNSHRKATMWQPFGKLDPSSPHQYEGPEEGVGAVTRWDGNRKLGKGSSTIVESRTDQFVRCRLDFEKPMKITHTADFDLAPRGGQTEVTWSMRGRNGACGKAMSLLMNCEKMIGPMFEEGLQSLKALVEKEAR